MNPIFDHTLPLKKRIKHLVSELTIDEKINLLPTRQGAIPRLGIKEYFLGAEGAHGLLVRRWHDPWPSGNSTVFPQPIGLSCTWNKDLLHRVGDVISTEARIWYEKDKKVQWLTLWFPTIDMERDPRWGRNEEAYGEDPYLAGKLSAALIRGVQGGHKFYLKAACAPKHFYGNNMEKDRGSTSTNIGERVKHEYYLKVFKHAFLEGKCHSLMTAYNEINGIPCIANPENVSIVKEKWGCTHIVADGDDLPQTVTLHHFVKTQAEAIALALKNGVDAFPVQKNEIVTDAAYDALKEGFITEKDIDRAITNTLTTRFRLGQFDPPEANPYSGIKKEKLCAKAHLEVALQAARESVVLLKNDGILPLDPEKCKKVLLIGDLAQTNMADWYSGKPPHVSTISSAIGGILQGGSEDAPCIHNLCALYCDKANAWVCVDEKGEVTFDENENARAIFEEVDWGFDSVSYRHAKTKKYLNVTNDLTLGCTSDAVWGWFTMEQFFRKA